MINPVLVGLELREIRSFLVVAEELHFGRAGDRLGVSASRVSQLVRQLETRVGTPLFERTSRRVALTSAGQQLAAQARDPLAQLDQAFADAREAAIGVAGTLALGMFSPLAGGPWLLDIVAAFQAAHPACTVQTVSTSGDRTQVEWLRDGRADVLAIRLPIKAPDVTIGPVLSREPRVALVAETDPLADRQSIEHDDLSGRRIARPPHLDKRFRDAFFPLETPSGGRLDPVEIADIAELPVRVALGDLVHLTVPSFLERYRFDRVKAIPVTDLPPSETALAWIHDGPRQRAFAQAARAIVSAHL